ncbi:MAG: hypothetical protein OEL88_15840 [Sterolibacteriaceae bacterium MAG5]|nr:hypothetical protein [Candidatus Nitricoxidireducens bremensis]
MDTQQTNDAAAGRGHRVDEAMETEAIRALQERSGLTPCFRTGYLLICAGDCQWRQPCRRPVAEWRREW